MPDESAPASTPGPTSTPGPAQGRLRLNLRRREPRPSALEPRWTSVEGVKIFYRESPGPKDSATMMHVHGFGLSGRYLLPTAELLAHDFHTLVPDLPGFGRSGRSVDPLGVEGMAHAAASFLDERGIPSASLVGNSMGCAVICEFAHHYPEKLDRAVLVAPAGGMHNQPLATALRQLVIDSVREPPRLATVAVPDYLRFGVPSTLRLFRALTRFPSLDRLLALKVPTLVVVGNADPLMPGPPRIKEVAGQTENSVLLVVIHGAAHAINFSHPGELANVIRQFMSDKPIVDDPDSPGDARVYEIHRGGQLPEVPGSESRDELARAVVRRPHAVGDRRLRRSRHGRAARRLRAPRGARRRLRQRRHVVVREAHADPARLHGSPSRGDGRDRRVAAHGPALPGRLRGGRALAGCGHGQALPRRRRRPAAAHGGGAAAFDTVPVEEYDGKVVGFFGEASHPSLGRAYRDCGYAPMVELLRYLEEHGFSTWIASGGDRDFMRPIAARSTAYLRSG